MRNVSWIHQRVSSIWSPGPQGGNRLNQTSLGTPDFLEGVQATQWQHPRVTL